MEMANQLASRSTWIVLLHLVVLFCHGAAHQHLGISANPWQTAFIASIIFVGPVFALILTWARRQKAGVVLLGLTMAGSLVFGLFYHFVAPGPDNACSLSNAGWGGIFRTTSVLLAVIEAAACSWCILVMRRTRGS